MMTYPPGATPLDADELEGLLHPHARTRAALNYLEAANIRKAEKWAFGQSHGDLLTPSFIQMLHRRMFGEVWRWAGQYRKTEKNIDVLAWSIPIEVHKACLDVEAQALHKSYSIDELAARFHHRLVYIHPFPNGNGRLSRMMADLLLVSYKEVRFSWGIKDLLQQNDVRARYLDALRAADTRNYKPLLEFIRS